ncbi:MAG: LytTR family DNA-binding domain-containing protein [Bacteroidales bacterium]
MRVLKIQTPVGRVCKLHVPSKSSSVLITLTDIIYVNSDRNYSYIYTTCHNCKVTVCATLKKISELLHDFGFRQVHQSYLVNLMHIHGYTKGNPYMLKLTNGYEACVSLRRKEMLDFLVR